MRESCFVEILDDRGNIMMLAKGEAVSVGVMKMDARARGNAMTTGYMAEVHISSESGEFLGGGPAAAVLTANPFVCEGDEITMNIQIRPPIRQESVPAPQPKKVGIVARMLRRFW